MLFAIIKLSIAGAKLCYFPFPQDNAILLALEVRSRFLGNWNKVLEPEGGIDSPLPHLQPAPSIPTPRPNPPAVGPTRDAEPEDQANPEITEALKVQEFKTSVRVRVEISETGTAVPVLRTSSGNPEIDRLVLEALRKWRWKPALRNGQPVPSVKLFPYDIQVR